LEYKLAWDIFEAEISVTRNAERLGFTYKTISQSFEIAVQSTIKILGLILGCPIGPAYYGKGTNSRTHHTSN
jgi:hypothetical protein